MKHLRIYEEFTTNDIQVGDYVLLKNTIKFYLSSFVTTGHVKKCLEFLSNNIGVVIEIDKDEKTKNIESVVVQYYDVDFFIKHLFYDGTLTVTVDEIKYISKTPEDIKIQIDAEKYNI